MPSPKYRLGTRIYLQGLVIMIENPASKLHDLSVDERKMSTEMERQLVEIVYECARAIEVGGM